MINKADHKIRVPQVLQKILPRHHIAKTLDAAALTEALCLVAPYGCGKTLAVLFWLRERNHQAAWVSLDETDDTETVFVKRLAAAILPFAAEQDDVDFLSEPRYTEDPGAFLRKAVSYLAEGNITADTLVIDNFHYIRNDGLLRLVKDFIHALLGHLRVIIISRTQLSPVFNDLMLKKHICLITIQELSFSLEEMSEYFSMNGRSVPRSNLAQIYQDTEGWPAAINVILTITREVPNGYGEDAYVYVKGFFETEIWNGLDETIKVFLMKTSVLETLTPSSCHAVTEMGATLPVLRWLFENGIFVSRLPGEDNYRYHLTFKSFLLDKLGSSGLDTRELYMKAAWWLYDRKEYARSFPYFFKARDLFGLSQVLRILSPAEMGGIENFLALTACITDLNIEELKSYPVIVARMALTHYLKGNLAEMQRLYGIFREWTEPGALSISPEDYGEYLWEAGWLSYINPAEAVRGNKKHEEWANYREYVPFLRPMHLYCYSVLRFPAALRGIRDYCSVVDSIDAFVKWNEETGYSIIREKYALREMDLIRAEYAYETEHYDKAENLVRSVMAEAENQRVTSQYFVCTVLLVKLARAVHNPKEIDVLTVRLEEMIKNNGDTFLLPNFHAFQLRNRLAGGQAGFTEEFERENMRHAVEPYFYLLYRQIALVRGLLSLGSFSEAMLLLGNLALVCNKYDRTMDLMEVNILKAIASYGLHNEDGTRRYLVEALQEAEKYGFIRIFSDDAKELWPILELVKKQKAADTYLKNIIISCKKALTRAGIKPQETCDELTKTELKILRSLKAGMSYAEIALDNGIKLPTVKSHAHSIYSKLQVDNRVSAVIKAQNAGILD
jgi:ATP/maltotriose-dependent transcriptional regulator MalT